MIWFTLPNDERLRLWKKLRTEISEMDIADALKEIAKFCGSIPYGSRSIDYYSPEDWPTPWEILYHGSFCTSSISLLIFYTVVLMEAGYTADLLLVRDSDDTYLLPLINDQFILNYELGTVNKLTDIAECFEILQKFPESQVKTIT